VEVDVASLETGIERRDNHLRTADFFDVERFPTAHSARARRRAEREERARQTPRYRAKFDFDIHGVKKTLDGDFEVTPGFAADRGGRPHAEPRRLPDRRAVLVVQIPGSIAEEVPVHFRATLPPVR
jgi:hypothetical protein